MELGIVLLIFDADDLILIIAIIIIIFSLRLSFLTCKHGKIFLSSIIKKIGALFLIHLISSRNLHILKCRKICRGGKNLGVLLSRGGICHPMPPHGYGPDQKGTGGKLPRAPYLRGAPKDIELFFNYVVNILTLFPSQAANF